MMDQTGMFKNRKSIHICFSFTEFIRFWYFLLLRMNRITVWGCSNMRGISKHDPCYYALFFNLHIDCHVISWCWSLLPHSVACRMRLYLLHFIHHTVFHNEISFSFTLYLFYVAPFISSPLIKFLLSRPYHLQLSQSPIFLEVSILVFWRKEKILSCLLCSYLNIKKN